MIEGWAACFAGLDEPREARTCDHQRIDILVITVCAVIAGAESWEDIALYGRQLGLPVAYRLVAEDDAAGQDHLGAIAPAELVTKPPEHHEGAHVGGVLGPVQRRAGARR